MEISLLCCGQRWQRAEVFEPGKEPGARIQESGGAGEQIVLVVVLVLDCGHVESPESHAGIGGMLRVWTVGC